MLTGVQQYIADVQKQAEMYNRIEAERARTAVPVDRVIVRTVPVITPDYGLMAKIDRVCDAIWQATDAQPEQPADLLAEWDAELTEEAEEIASDAIAEAVASTVELMAKPEPTLLERLRQHLVASNPWEILEGWWREIIASPACALALDIIFRDESWLLPQIRGGAEPKAARLRVVQQAEKELLETRQEGAKTKPADVARRWVLPLRALAKLGQPTGHFAEQLLLECSMPEGEILSPEWVDPYTGVVDPDAQRITIKNIPTPEKANTPEALAEAFSEGFNADDGLEIEHFDDVDPREPQWMEMQEDLQPTDELPALRKKLETLTDRCRDEISRLVEDLNQSMIEVVVANAHRDPVYAEITDVVLERAASMMVRYPKHQDWPSLRNLAYNLHKQFGELIAGTKSSFAEHISLRFQRSEQAKHFLSALQDEADHGAAPQDLFVLFSSFQHGLGFPEDAAEQIELVGQYPTLFDFAEDWGDFVLECINDRSSSKAETDLAALDQFAAETLKLIVEANKEDGSKDITRSPEYIQAFFKVMFEARDTSTRRNGKFVNLAVEAGWDAWREAKSPKGNKAYKQALASGAEPKEAMKSFWRLLNKANPRKDYIVSLTTDGILLASGRKISYYIATLKLKNNELEFEEGTRERIKKALLERKIGLAFANAL